MSTPILPSNPGPNGFIMCGLDADEDLSSKAAWLKSLGFGFVSPYLRAWFTELSVTRLHKAGMLVGPTFWETSATEALAGASQGVVDGSNALKMMSALGAPNTASVCFTVDTDAGQAQLYQIENYFAAADGILWGHFRISGYADGTAISGLRQHGLPLCVLAGAMGWDGSKAFALTGKPNVIQGPTIDAGKSAAWPAAGEIPNVDPIEWPALDFAYDPEIALTSDFGQW